MENQTGKENKMRLEYQAKRDLGLQSMGHGEQSWLPRVCPVGLLVLSCYFVLGTALDPGDAQVNRSSSRLQGVFGPCTWTTAISS